MSQNGIRHLSQEVFQGCDDFHFQNALMPMIAFSFQSFQQFGIGLEKVDKTAVIAPSREILGPQRWRLFGPGIAKRLLAVFLDQVDFGVVAKCVGPEPEIVIGR